jgi:hypothetical protein
MLAGLVRGFRGSELEQIDIRDLRILANGVAVNLPRLKTYQEGAGREGGLPCESNPDV